MSVLGSTDCLYGSLDTTAILSREDIFDGNVWSPNTKSNISSDDSSARGRLAEMEVLRPRQQWDVAVEPMAMLELGCGGMCGVVALYTSRGAGWVCG